LTISVIHGDCRDMMSIHGTFDMILADPPYGDTSLAWDKRVNGWEKTAAETLKPTGSLWLFGSLRSLMLSWPAMQAAGFKYAQEIIWEKHNGSGFHKDRFKRVHEIVVQFYRQDAPWAEVYNDVQVTHDAVERMVKRKKGRPAHMGHIEAAPYASEDGGPRIMRSVIYMPNCHGEAIHETEKPVGLLEILIRTSCPQGGTVADFFAGSGSAGEACAHAGRNYVGTESSATMAAKANRRLAQNLFSAHNPERQKQPETSLSDT
jgi:site-specific DNA-methyltransferase (adenine-specific)